MDVNNFREKLKKEIHEYMDMQISSRNVTAITDMIACLGALDAFEGAKDAEHFDMSTAQKWVDGMKNDDGTHGAHWTIEQTTAVAESLDIPLDTISEYCWWATMNMMYSDYVNVAIDYKVDVPDFYANLAEAFLFDKDAGSPKQKLGAYYSCIAKHN